MTVPDSVLLFAVRRAHARIHVEYDCLSADANHGRHRSIGPRVSKSRKVLFRRKPLRLEAAHLARRADMQVCNCNGVTKAALGACVAAGNRTTKAVMDATRAGKGCGSCKNLGRPVRPMVLRR